MNQTESHNSSDDPIYRKLVESSFYQTYKKAFSNATGMSLALLPPDSEMSEAEGEERHASNFCQKLNCGDGPCSRCSLTSQCLFSSGKEKAETITCFAKMRESVIPIRVGNYTAAYLSTGEVFTEKPDEAGFEEVAAELRKGIDCPENMEELREAWLSGNYVDRAKYEGTITLLAAFGLQLSDLVNRLMVEEANAEPEVISRAKQYINANLENKIILEEVASHVGVSSFYFCKVFKQSIGMTLTEYVNRRRVEWAKRKLLNPRNRVTEVAFDVGYQSLSQFNRCFAKYVGMSPTRYREQKRSAKGIEPLQVA